MPPRIPIAAIAPRGGDNPVFQFIARYQADPVLFVREVWAAEPDQWQGKALGWYGARERHISIRSAHGVGKTAFASWTAWHQILTRFPQKTIVTAPSSPQLFDALWPEINKWGKRLPPKLQELFEFRSDHIFLKAAPEESFISARTARAESPENFQGIHSDNTLYLFDEASGVPDAIYESAMGSESDPFLTMVLISNATRRSGFFYDTHNDLAHLWKRLKVTWKDSPRTKGSSLEETTRITWGEDSNAYRVRVLAEFPTEEDDVLIPFELCEAAKERDITVTPGAGRVWGLDVARFGRDSSALCKRIGNVIPEPVQLWRGRDTMQTVGRVKAEWDRTIPSERPEEILVDVIGLGGGVVDRLRELKLPVRGINVGETPATNPERYKNVKAQLWDKAREWLFQRSGKLPDDDVLIRGLSSQKYKHASGGELVLVDKEETKAGIGRNQGEMDAADAFILTFASDAVTMIHGSSSRRAEAIKRRFKWIV